MQDRKGGGGSLAKSTLLGPEDVADIEGGPREDRRMLQS